MSSEEPPRDHAPGGENIDPDERTDSRKIEENVKSRSTWLRALFMVVFVFIYAVSRFVVGTVVVLQFFWVLFTGETNRNLLVFGHSLATYTSQMILYLTYNSDRRPFPFDEEWPPARLND